MSEVYSEFFQGGSTEFRHFFKRIFSSQNNLEQVEEQKRLKEIRGHASRIYIFFLKIIQYTVEPFYSVLYNFQKKNYTVHCRAILALFEQFSDKFCLNC